VPIIASKNALSREQQQENRGQTTISLSGETPAVLGNREIVVCPLFVIPVEFTL
jgi:hypothetical protein